MRAKTYNVSAAVRIDMNEIEVKYQIHAFKEHDALVTFGRKIENTWPSSRVLDVRIEMVEDKVRVIDI